MEWISIGKFAKMAGLMLTTFGWMRWKANDVVKEDTAETDA